MYLVLPENFDGFNGLISLDGENIAVGRGITSVINRKSFTTKTLFDGEASRPMGWYSNYQLIVQKYEDNCQVIIYNILTNKYEPLNINQNIQMGSSGLGHWVGGYAKGKRVVRDGVLLSEGIDWYCGGEGEWSVILSESDVYVYSEFDLIHKLPLPFISRYFAIVREGMCGFGRNGQPQLLNCLTGKITNESVCKYGESEPCFSVNQIATAIEHPSPFVAIRFVGKKECISLPVKEGCIGVDFKVIGETGIVYSWSNVGRGVIQNCDLNQERHLIEMPNPPITYLIDKRAPNPVGPNYDKPSSPDPIIEPFDHSFILVQYLTRDINI